MSGTGMSGAGAGRPQTEGRGPGGRGDGLRLPALPFNMSAEQDRQDHHVAEIRAEDGAKRPRERAQARPARESKKAAKERLAAEAAAAEVRILRIRRMGLGAALGALWILGGCGGGVSGEIGRACMTSGRDSASAQLCSCIQGVANQSLSGSDQRRAARFFGDPDRAQDVRLSDSAGDDAFWERYRAFATRAEAICR